MARAAIMGKPCSGLRRFQGNKDKSDKQGLRQTPEPLLRVDGLVEELVFEIA